MTQDQMLMLLRMALQGLGTFLIAKNIFTPADWTVVVGAVLQVAPLAWSLWARRTAGLKTTVGNLPGTVVVTASAGTSTATLADKIASLPDAHTVVTTSEVAAANPSPKVVAQ